MKKNDFVSLLLGVVGFLTFGVGMCMCLLPEWNLFKPGVAVIAVGIAVLAALAIQRWTLAGRPAIHVNGKLLGKALFGALGVLVMGGGMSMVLAMNMIVPGIVVSLIGIVLVLCLIPMTIGLK
ncbi:MAG: hypothetical protein IJ313_06995 [Clostridia bacterium]|nr:hypothetical protein [Clostridia bacterium]